jgi:hypothetical protein
MKMYLLQERLNGQILMVVYKNIQLQQKKFLDELVKKKINKTRFVNLITIYFIYTFYDVALYNTEDLILWSIGVDNHSVLM